MQDEASDGGFFHGGFGGATNQATDGDAGDVDASGDEFTEREDTFLGDFLLD